MLDFIDREDEMRGLKGKISWG